MKRVSWSLLFPVFLMFASYGLFQISKARDFQFFGRIVDRVSTPDRVIALTLDDGPTPEPMDFLLTTLGNQGVPATFFLIGQAMQAYPQGAARLLEAGHELGNHSYTHSRMVFKFPRFIREEIEKTDRLIRQAGFRSQIYFRPPYGKKLFLLPWYLDGMDRVTVTWDVEPESHPDVARDYRKIAEHVLARARPGSIILLHPWYPANSETRKALPLIIDGLKQGGYRFVTVSRLLEGGRDAVDE